QPEGGRRCLIEFRGPPEKQKKPAAKPRKAPAVPAVARVPRHEAQVKRRPGRPRTSLVKRAAPSRRPRAKRAQLGRRCKGLTAPALGVGRRRAARCLRPSHHAPQKPAYPSREPADE